MNSTIAVEGGGHVMEYPGGYSDYLRQRKRVEKASAKPTKKPGNGKPARTTADALKKMTFKEEHELGVLPDRIKALENAKAELEKALSDPDLFARDAAAYETAANKLAEVETAIASAEDRWLELEARRESLDAAR